MDMTWFYAAAAAVFGIVIGSFLNVCIYRIPKHISINGNQGRSMCPWCGHTLRWYDLFPVFSYLFLRGKCRYCKGRISARYPIVECLNAGLWGITAGLYGLTGKTAALCLFFSLLIVMSGIDLEVQLIPNRLQLILLVLGIVSLWVPGFPEIKERLIGLLIISVPMQLIAILIPNGFGGGDIKLMAVCGFLLGYKSIVLAMLIGTIFCGIYGIVLLSKGKGRRVKIPFGPFLAAGLILASLWGELIWNAYWSMY